MEYAMENSLTRQVLSNRFLRNFVTYTAEYSAPVYSISTTSSSYVFLQARAENNRQISRVKKFSLLQMNNTFLNIQRANSMWFWPCILV